MKSFIQHINEKKNTGDGNCMEAAANLMLRYNSPFFGKQLKANNDTFLVHSLVHGQGECAGLRFSHAWVEDGSIVIDKSNGNDIRMEAKIYYAIGGVNKTQKGAYVRYSFNEMKRKLNKTKHYGPWDLDMNLEESNMISSVKQIGRKKKPVPASILSSLKETMDEGIVTNAPTTQRQFSRPSGSRTSARGREDMRRQEPHTVVTWNDLKRLETVLDAMFRSASLDIAFTKHFLERMNGSRGYGGTVSIPEIQDAFRKTYGKYAQQIKAHPADWKAIILDVGKELNMPFTLEWDGRMKKMVMLTAMKKRNFMSNDPKLPV